MNFEFWRNRSIQIYILLATLATMCYSLGLSGPLFFDDRPALTGNPLLFISGTELDQWRTASLSSDSGPLKRPIAMFTFASSYVLSDGWSPKALKLFNLILHLLVGALIYRFMRILVSPDIPSSLSPLARNWLPAVTTALWLLSPLHVSTVLYSVQRMTQLSTLFVMLGMVYFLRCRARWAVSGASSGEVISSALWMSLCVAAAALCKENGILLLWLVPLLECTVVRGRWGGYTLVWLERAAWAVVLLPILLFVTVFLFTPDILPSFERRPFSLEERLLTQLRVLWHYVGWLTIPDISAMSFQHDYIEVSRSLLNPVSTVVAGVAWIAVIMLAVVYRSRSLVPLLGLLLFLIGHSLESSFWPLDMVYEHRNYLPSLGVFIVIAWLILEIARPIRALRPSVCLAIIIPILSCLLAFRAHSWSDEMLLAWANVENHPNSARSNYFYALALIEEYERDLDSSEEQGGPDQENLIAALHYYERMLQEDPGNFAALATLFHLYDRYIPPDVASVDWLSELKRSAKDRVLLVSDRMALQFLVQCYEVDACTKRGEEVLGILRELQQRFPRNSAFVFLEYRLASHLFPDGDEHQALLAEAIELSPGNLQLYSFAIKQAISNGDIESAYEAAGTWLQYDRLRTQLPMIKRWFQADGASGE